jgi:hypothetical protein
MIKLNHKALNGQYLSKSTDIQNTKDTYISGMKRSVMHKGKNRLRKSLKKENGKNRKKKSKLYD